MLPIVTPGEMAAIDAAAPEPVEVLIARAGAAVARAALDLLGGSYGRRVVVIAGPGNNGADALAAAQRLERRGVRCLIIDPRSQPDVLPHADLVIDGAYGTGLRRSYMAPRLPHDNLPVLAVDIPSGLSGATGQVSGRALPARRTITFAALKPGLLLGEGPALAGEVEVADIGLDTTGARAWLLDDASAGSLLPRRARDAHKWHAAVRVLAGSAGMVGAASLTSAAAMRAGAGYVRLSVPGAGSAPIAPLEAVATTVSELGWAPQVLADLDRFRSLAIGPGLGLGEDTANQVRLLVSSTTIATVVDGDGLRALGPDAAAVVAARPLGAQDVVLTPHDGEFAALGGACDVPDRLESVRSLASSLGAVVLAKGPTTVVADPTGRVLVTCRGDQRLATAGSGDVLTGVIAAFTAMGLDPWRAAAVGAHVHGVAGDLACARGMVAGDLVDHLPAALAQLAGG